VLRYYAIATIVVLTIAVAVTAWSTGNLMRFHLASSKHAMPPQHLRLSEGAAAPGGGEVTGDAPWALSALPECFAQRQETTGNAADVRAKLPAGARPIPAGTRLAFGSCTIFVRNGELLVVRGADRLRIPPRATLYRIGRSLALVRTSGKSAVLRTYDIIVEK
jgi:hypothetical protein